MHVVSDIVAYSSSRQPVLVVECKLAKVASPEYAARFRRNLLTHGLVADVPYFLLAFPTGLYLWKSQTAPTAPPDFASSAKAILQEYLGKPSAQDAGVNAESLERAIYWWLSDLATTVREPQSMSEADQMMVNSGVYDLLKRGEVKSEVIQ